MKSKKIGRADIIGDKGIALVHRRVLDMGFVWNRTNLEAGIDGYIEIRDEATGDVTNCILQVQSKATSRPFQAETDAGFEFVCDERDLNYWLGGNAPVILVVSRPDSEEAYWVSVKDYFRDPRSRQERKVYFHKHAARFDRSCREKLARLAIPADSGIYLASVPRDETLYTNLLPVRDAPRRLFRAKTEYRRHGEVWARLRELGASPGQEWILHDGCLYSFMDVVLDPWTKICDSKTAENKPTTDWSKSNEPSRQYVFVRLLNRCLRAMLDRHEVWYSEIKECFYFRATPDRSVRKIGNISVFKAYKSKTNPERIAYYRHRAFHPQFVRFDQQWYLEITPSYYFTTDGTRLSRFYEERLSGIKLLERQNKTHLAQVRMWADLLTNEERPQQVESTDRQQLLFDEEDEPAYRLAVQPYRYLSFDPLVSLPVDFGVDDAAWLPERGGEDEDEDSAQGRLF